MIVIFKDNLCRNDGFSAKLVPYVPKPLPWRRPLGRSASRSSQSSYAAAGANLLVGKLDLTWRRAHWDFNAGDRYKNRICIAQRLSWY
jgi:hypothetical protein